MIEGLLTLAPGRDLIRRWSSAFRLFSAG